MPRYGSGMSGEGQTLVANIREGRTEFARKRAFRDNLVKTGVIAGLQGLSGVSKYVESENAQADAKEAAKNNAIANALKHSKLPPSHPDDTARDEYGLEVQRPEYGKAMNASVTEGQVSPQGPLPPRTSADMAKETLEAGRANDAALAAPIAGRWTARGFQDADMNATVNASDIERAKAMMRFGGLQNSFNGGN